MKTKRERFETVAAKRVQRVISDLDSLGKCSNKNNYDFSEDDIRKMMSVIKKKIRNVEEVYFSSLGNGENKFKF